MNWAYSVVSMELRKLFSYRANFWFDFLGRIVTIAGVAYFLWGSIYDSQGASELGGYSFHAMMLYYVLAPLIDKLVMGQEFGGAGFAEDIYEGALSRYLIYPVPVFGFKYLRVLAYWVIGAIQFVIALLFFSLIFGLPSDAQITPMGLLAGVSLTLLGGLVYFMMVVGLELVAFWADNVWSLLVMVRMMNGFLGGLLIPITFFPDWLRASIEWTPFPYFISLPVRLIMGQAELIEVSKAVPILVFWLGAVSLLVAWIWRRGLKQYTGVGI